MDVHSLWLSLPDSTDHTATHEAARRHLEGWLTPHRVGDALTMIAELVHHVQSNGDSGELILSRHDDTLLIEVVARSPASARTPADGGPLRMRSARPHTWGSHPTADGVVVWVQMPVDSP
ncbi:hypothetical protein [Actinoplanes xinjiangensis]|uniref:hypothetical protein n=1 Tax=Actinoplanes xinjiangensis TaxID=512350 RepID=UPI0034443A06